MQAYNPYLPCWEYIPDAEPYVFGDRVYIYGSHDRFNAPIFCVKDYVCWSAPVSDLSDWTCSGVIYKKNQDPMNRMGLRLLFAPDVTRGPDGRYYLYYAFDFMGVIGVAVCDTPDGHYEFYGHVHDAQGRLWGRRKGDEFPFDPAVLTDDDGRVYLYSGFETPVPAIMTGMRKLKNSGCVAMELEADMVTMKIEPKLLLPCKDHDPPKAFAGHTFFEASSIHKIDGKYILSYSSANNHELCYAVGDSPLGPFAYGGTLVDQGDLYKDGNADESRAVNYLGNTHGGLAQLGGDWYVFYHRQTNRHSYSRQACAEKLARRADGGFEQAEVTSCGLNGGALAGEGEYPAYIACNLWSRDGTARYDKPFDKKAHPYLTQDKPDGDKTAVQYVANMRDGAVAGFKYFDLREGEVSVRVGGTCSGVVEVSTQADLGRIAARIQVDCRGAQSVAQGHFLPEEGAQALYFRFRGRGAMNFYAFTLS